jgi:hypothetical protein
VAKLEEIRHKLEGNIKMNFKQDGRVWTEFFWLRQGQVAGCSERNNELPGSIKCGEFLDQVRVY